MIPDQRAAFKEPRKLRAKGFGTGKEKLERAPQSWAELSSSSTTAGSEGRFEEDNEHCQTAREERIIKPLPGETDSEQLTINHLSCNHDSGPAELFSFYSTV